MASPDVVVWEYETDLPGLFAPYEDKLSNEIEKAYVKDQNEQHLDLGAIDHLLLQYEVDFVAMIQTSKRSKLSKTIYTAILLNNMFVFCMNCYGISTNIIEIFHYFQFFFQENSVLFDVKNILGTVLLEVE